jgi:hypothetical protein
LKESITSSSLNKGARTFGFWYYNAAKTAWSNAGGFSYSSEVGNIAIVSTAASGMRLWFSGNMNGSTHIGEFSLALSAGKVVLGSSQVYTIERTYTTQNRFVRRRPECRRDQRPDVG